MLPVQPRRRRQRDEELTPVGIRPRVRHAQDSRASVFERRVDLVLELLAVDARPTAPGPRRVARLHHEVRDYAVEEQRVVVSPLGERLEILAGLHVCC